MLLEKIGYPSMLEQTAEECSELSQACLKLSRYMRRENPTDKDLGELKENLAEEAADVLLCLDELKLVGSQDVAGWIDYKKNRISERFD